jgi:outer membrane autotransporter protein
MRARSLWTRFAVMVVAALLVSALLPARAQAQTFGESFVGRLDGTCRGLNGDSSSTGSGTYGPHLAAICTGIPSAASGAASIMLDSRNSEMEDQRLLKRLRERRQQKAASADDATGMRGLSLYASGDYQYAEKGVTKFEPGYERDTWGGTLGADYVLRGGMALVGAAFNYAHQSGNFLRRAGNFDTDSFGPTIYVSVFPTDNVFVDGYVGYTRHEYDIVRRFTFIMNSTAQVPSGRTEGETSGNEYKAGVNAGYDFHFGPFTVGPRVGVDFRENHIDGYTESGATGFAQGLELIFEKQHQTSLTSKLGAFASLAHSTGWGVLVPQATFEWRHEFEDDQRPLYFRFKEDLRGAKFRYLSDSPDRDYFNASLGLVVLLPNGLAPFVNVREFFGYTKQSSTTVTAGLRVSF